MTKKAELVPVDDVSPTERLEQEGQLLEIGQWYWVDETSDEEDEADGAEIEEYDEEGGFEDKPTAWLGCLLHIGSNYVKVESPKGRSLRIHMDAFDQYLTLETDAQDILNGRVSECRERVATLMGEVKAVTARLGVSPRTGIEMKPESETHALVRVTSESPDPKTYENALVKAKDETLPELFKKIERAHSEMATWMGAEMLPLKAHAAGMQGCIKVIEGRIFNVSLYAGITEEVVQFAEGEPSSFDDKLHLMQRRCYMDEECLLDYQGGGMEFADLTAFNEWLAVPKHRDRILPFPRCMVAMRVRRNDKERETSDLLSMFINMGLKQADKSTFLFIRNGENLYCMECDLEFDELIFPNRDEFDISGPMMFKRCSWGKIDLITLDDYETQIEDYEAAVKADKKWRRNHPKKRWTADWVKQHTVEMPEDDYRYEEGVTWIRQKEGAQLIQLRRYNLEYQWHGENPFVGFRGELRTKDPRTKGWETFDKSSLHYDEAMADVKTRVDYYNRLSLIIQGLYDRSEILHPHPPVKTWTSAGFAAAVELVYDSDRTLHAGEKPSFEEYWEGMTPAETGSVVIGQESEWLEHVQEKEDERRSNNYREIYGEVSGRWKPEGDKGPGYLARVSRIQRKAGKATFRWMRQRKGGGWRGGSDHDMLLATFGADLDALFNVSAYKPGDFLQFFQDPRTRAEYIRWAPLLLTAEDFHAGKRECQEPAETPKDGPTMGDIASKILVQLRRMEVDKKINVPRVKGARSPFYRPRTTVAGRFIKVTCDNYYVSTSLSKGDALRYLRWLDAGNTGTCRECAIEDYQ